MATTEPTMNDALAALLRRTRRAWREQGIVRSENTSILRRGGVQPDILIVEPYMSPVTIETEVMPAATVEVDARLRLGEGLYATGRKILSSIAVRLPRQLRDKDGDSLTNEQKKAGLLQMVMFTGISPDKCSRWPKTGWMHGGLIDLSLLL